MNKNSFCFSMLMATTICLFTSVSTYGQGSLLQGIPAFKEWSSLTEQALQESFFLVRVEYLLEEKSSGNRYGRNSQDYYNRLYTVGVRVNGRLWANSYRLNEPWADDPEFDKYRDDDAYLPVVSNYAVRPLNGREFKKLDNIEMEEFKFMEDLSLGGIAPIPNDSLSLEPNKKIFKRGLCVFLGNGDKLLEDESTDIDLEFRWLLLNTNRQGSNNVSFKADEDIMQEGILLNANASVGVLDFKVDGLLFQSDEESTRWNICRVPPEEEVLTAPDLPGNHLDAKGDGSSGNDDLSPVPEDEELTPMDVKEGDKPKKKKKWWRRKGKN